MPAPSKKELLRFLGMATYTMKLTPNDLYETTHLKPLLKGDVPRYWDENRCRSLWESAESRFRGKKGGANSDMSSYFNRRVPFADTGCCTQHARETVTLPNQPPTKHSHKHSNHTKIHLRIPQQKHMITIQHMNPA